MLLTTSLVIEITLMPIALYHFNRAGIYGLLANIIAIPLVTFIIMPLIAMALLADCVGLGGVFWWAVDIALQFLLNLAHFIASLPGAQWQQPQMGDGVFMLFIGGILWLGLWRSKARYWGFMPIAIAIVMMALTPKPALFISNDGKQVALFDSQHQLYLLRNNPNSYSSKNISDSTAFSGEARAIQEFPGAQCSKDFCSITLQYNEKSGGQNWRILVALSDYTVPYQQILAACEQSDIVISHRYLPQDCQPHYLKADKACLDSMGGMALYPIKTDNEGQKTIAYADTASQNHRHPWWRGGQSFGDNPCHITPQK